MGTYREKLSCEWDDNTEEVKEMARQIAKTFCEKGLTVCAAKEVLCACEIYVEFNSTVSLAP